MKESPELVSENCIPYLEHTIKHTHTHTQISTFIQTNGPEH